MYSSWEVLDGIIKFVMYFNVIISLIQKVYVNVKYALFKANCMSCYGCVLWRLSSKEIINFKVNTKTNMIKDVLYTRDLNERILNIEELNFLINFLCT